MSGEKVIPFDSPEAARLVTVTGWVSSDGRFFGNLDDAERIARYAGCTHQPCGECGVLCEKMYTRCPECRAKEESKRFAEKKRQEWDCVGLYETRQAPAIDAHARAYIAEAVAPALERIDELLTRHMGTRAEELHEIRKLLTEGRE